MSQGLDYPRNPVSAPGLCVPVTRFFKKRLVYYRKSEKWLTNVLRLYIKKPPVINIFMFETHSDHLWPVWVPQKAPGRFLPKSVFLNFWQIGRSYQAEEGIFMYNLSFWAFASLKEKKILLVKSLMSPEPGVRRSLKLGIKIPIFQLNFTLWSVTTLEIHRNY